MSPPGRPKGEYPSAQHDGSPVSAATLVVELYTEELPPKALRRLGEAFAGSMVEGLRARGLLAGTSVATSYATPRRLAVAVTQVLAVAPDSEVIDKLMPAKVARGADGQPTEALRKKLGALGRPQLATSTLDATDGPDRIYVASDGKAEYVYLRSLAKGQALARGLQAALDDALAKLPIPKVMTYASPGGYWNAEKFVRPAHRLVALHGADVVAVKALGLDAGRTTGGHRFLGRSDIAIATADAYGETLWAEGKVIASFDDRRAAIEQGLAGAAQGDRVVAPDALLDEVASLVEWPAVYAGTFDPAFLSVPQECLILTMQQNQKYFALTDDAGRIRARFLLVSNLATDDPAAIVAGNERVLRARLADAKFFYDQDRRQRLDARLPKLRSVVYHNKLGTQAERIDRLRFLAAEIAKLVGADAAHADRAAGLAKADLVTDMVGEFPELQGLMGRYYAEHDGEPADVAAAVEQHYWPRFAGDALPEGRIAAAVALADKLEAMAGMFGIGNVPTGDKDPFGLRRAALGVLRIVIEKKLPLPVPDLLDLAFKAFDGVAAVKPDAPALASFLYDRLRGYLRDQGYTALQIAAVVDRHPARVDLVPAQLAAVRAFEALPEAPALAAANKRIGNILAKSAPGADGRATVDPGRFAEPAERALSAALDAAAPAVDAAMARGDYVAALSALASLRPQVDAFFDGVMVMADDPAVRANRLALLARLHRAMNQVADLAKLAG
jgi:glycyl-tRNA synthetase beta chain